MATMTEQLMLEAASRIIQFSYEDHIYEARAIEPYILGDAVAVDVWSLPAGVGLRFMVACSAERLTPSLEGQGAAYHRILLRPHTKSANPILDLMNEYEVWKSQQR
ncbi:MAG: hypothetical protein JNL05_10440 [Flavobacteriales bacterium]|nr:hypothetical protein [Flavobacteriales bacterium]